MIESAEIKNFRCFDNANLTGCRPVNVVLGRNATGKTAFLEALFLAIGASPEIALRYRVLRGYPPVVTGSVGEGDENTWKDLFFDFNVKNQIEISVKGTDDHKRRVRVSFDKSTSFQQTSHNISNFAPIIQSPSGIKFHYHRDRIDSLHKAKDWDVTGTYGGNGYQFSGLEAVPLQGAYFSSQFTFITQEAVDRYTQLRTSGDDDEVMTLINDEFGIINGLEILSSGGVATLHARSSEFRDKRNISAISSGVAKYISIMLAIATMSKGVVIIDEIENGFYYDRYETIWRSIIKLAREREVQIFATTHNMECLSALARASETSQDDVAFLRMERDGPKILIANFQGSTTFDAIKAGIDPR